MDTDALQAIVNSKYEFISSKDGSFGQWISGLWSYFPDLSYEDQKEAFLFLIRRLLEDDKIILFMPRNVPEIVRSEGSYWDIWDVPIGDMIDHIRRVWPADANEVEDEKLTFFWYEGDCPNIGWIDPETREIVAS